MRPDDPRAAVHEASHLLTGLAVGYRAARASLEPEPGHRAIVEFEPGPPPVDLDGARLAAAHGAAVRLAGPAGERLAFGDVRLGGLDEKDFDGLCGLVEKYVGGASEWALRTAVIPAVEHYLRRRWADMIALAGLLMRERTIGHDQAVAAVGTVVALDLANAAAALWYHGARARAAARTGT